MLDAWYQKPGDAVPLPQSYDGHLTYDNNGNILTLDRNGSTEVTFPAIVIDELTYQYDLGNKLLTVDDMVAHPEGFDDGNTGTTDDYDYDDFGNLTLDMNKGITLIQYNHQNLPTKVTFGTQGDIEYLYTADGTKIKKTVTEGTTVHTTTYRDGFQYDDGTLDFFPHAEGEVQVTYGQYGLVAYNYVFHYTDHLGNIRVRYAQDPDDGVLKILEEKHYYPYGLQHTGYNSGQKSFSKIETSNSIALTPVNPFLGDTYKYGYNGVEFNDDLGLNLHAMDVRLYDPALGRFNGFDPVTHFSQGTSVAFDNNPVFWADPSGADSFAGGRGESLSGGLDYSPGSTFSNELNKFLGQFDNSSFKSSITTALEIIGFEKDRPKQPNDPGRKYVPPSEGGNNDDTCNCHSFTWHDGEGDPTDIRNIDPMIPVNWDNNPDDDLEGWREMPFDEPNMPGDRILYINPEEINELNKRGIAHSATVIKVDEEGYTERVISKFGTGEVFTHQPTDVPSQYGTKRIYLRLKKIDRKNARLKKRGKPLIKSY